MTILVFPFFCRRMQLLDKLAVASLFIAKTTAFGRETRRASERSGVPARSRTLRFSPQEGPLGQEGEPYARLAKLVPCTVGMQVSGGDNSEVSQAHVLREIAAADWPDSAGVVSPERERVG